MKFRNKTNGYEETVSTPWLWTILFGGLYFIAKGLIAPLVIWLILAITFYASMGAPATILLIIMNIIMATLSGSIIRAAYLRKGWEIIEEDGTAIAPANDNRKCPFCAEQIKAEAIKCKHCGSDVPPQ